MHKKHKKRFWNMKNTHCTLLSINLSTFISIWDHMAGAEAFTEWSGGKAGKQSVQVTRPSRRKLLLCVVGFCLDSFSRIKLNRADCINCKSVFSPSVICFETKTKGSPSHTASWHLWQGRQELPPPLLYLGGRRSLFWAQWWESLTTSKTCRAFSNPSSNERRPSCTCVIIAASLRAELIL